MASPVITHYLSFIQIDRNSTISVYLQITTQMINAIQRGYLPKGTRLPGTRILGNLLQVNRNTIVKVYEELEAQGWIEVFPNKGSFIIQKSNDTNKKIKQVSTDYLTQYPSKTGFSYKISNLLDNPFESSTCSLALNDGIPDTRLLQIHLLSSLYSSNLKRKRFHKKGDDSFIDHSEYFKNNLSNFLNLTRGLHISKNNLLITRSIEMGVYIAAELLISPKDVVLVGELSFFVTNMILQKVGAEIVTIPVDEEGISSEAVKKLCEQRKIRMLYITPHHHYPTTVPLSAGRRLELLELSQLYGFIILEDDYDYDFHYENNRLLPLASADTSGMVVYIGSFGRSLAPGFRMGFVIAPENLISEMQKFSSMLDRQGDIFMEYALGELIEEGEIHRHLRKTSAVYKERRDYLGSLLKNQLNEYVNFTLPSGGLAIWTQWNSSINLMKLREICLKQDLFIPKSLLYQNKKISAMRFGFGNFTIEELKKIIEIIKYSLQILE
ncbi:PLP-dependent aminotransferase family protein [Apibacter sp.]|uniref:aminotransferase-like domain-containing protein n=1 Tax=Apibacter sp. TaxID=2023709 RepID=UPI0025F6FB37|nr:PLP-dependent aminotransferase family protein [Apibacter sp.]MCT6869132.1 PLP-dependent aminotransferase family protein [Apibacter sp.]